MSGLLAGRAVVVTGAGRGLGRSFAIAIAEAGAAVVVNDIDADEAATVVAEIEAAGGRAVASAASVAEWETAGELIDGCVEAFGSIDGLVNNAVAYPYYGPPWEESGEQIRIAVEVNLLGQLFCGAHAMRHMVAAGRGSIVNLTSRAHVGIVGASTYVTTKGAVASATYAWSLETAQFGVRVNALAPGAKTRGHELAGKYATYAKTTADSPDLVAPAVVYLLSDLSAALNGQIVLSMGRKLGLMLHPKVFDHIEERDAWTAEEIAATFERVYRAHLEPVGVTPL